MDLSSLRERPSANVISVAELNDYIKNIFDTNRALASVTVRGEISNFVLHRSGHLYFSLKDSESQIRSVMFRSSASRLKFIPENGMTVIAHGQVSVYSKDGTYQFYVNSLQPDGVGALYLAYEQLKAKLEAEGLFSPENKKKIPKYPEKIGVITSPTGAAVRDIINVTGRRYPFAKIYLYPALVQGESAEASLVKALDYFEKSKLCDVIIIGRGGGSIEDLWAFNGEGLARKIYAMSIPVISAVGHETDFTICDFVSDLRAPTPSAAAEIATPDVRELIMTLSAKEDGLLNLLARAVERKRERCDSLADSLSDAIKTLISDSKDKMKLSLESLERSVKLILKDKCSGVKVLAGKLSALSPLEVLSRGYSIVESSGATVKSVGELMPGSLVGIRLKDGKATAEIKEIKEVLK